MSTCKSCGARIIWAPTPAGKHIPVDADPTPDGNIELRDGIAHVNQQANLLGEARYVTHFATCPQADEHRRPR